MVHATASHIVESTPLIERWWTDLKTPVGRMRLTASASGLLRAEFCDEPRDADGECIETKILQQAKKELTEYFAGYRTHFEVPLDLRGRGFQLEVWRELQLIPFGTTTTYGEIAKRLLLENGARAVGVANGMNPVAVIVPCHRVVGQKNQITGYAGGIDRKAWLLKHECSTLV